MRPTRLFGFSLVEMLLYIAVASGVAVVLLQGIHLLLTMRERQLAVTEVSAQASWAMQRIADRVRMSGVSAPSSGESSAALALEDGTVFSADGGILIAQTATRSDALTGPEVTVSGVGFENFASGSLDIVTVNFTLSWRGFASGSSPYAYEEAFTTSVIPEN